MFKNISYMRIQSLIIGLSLLPCITSPSIEFSREKKSSDGCSISLQVIPVTHVSPQLNQIYTFTHSHFETLSYQAIQKFSTYTIHNWHTYFHGPDVHQVHQETRNIIFIQFPFYQFSAFRNYIATLEGYHEAMVGLHNQIMQDKVLAKNLDRVLVRKRYSVKDFVCEQVEQSKKIIALKHEERIRIQQAAIAKHQHEIALYQKQVTATIQAQQEDLTAIVDLAQSIDPQMKYTKDLHQRAHAINKAINEKFAASSKKHTVLPVTHTLLHTTGVDGNNFAQFHGNALQQLLHDEFVTSLNRAAILHVQHGHIPGVRHIAESAVEFAQVGIAYNNAGHLTQAMEISNLVSAINDYGWAVALGIKDGTLNIVHALTHPIDTVTNIARTANTVAYFLGKVLYELGDIELTYETDPSAAEDKIRAHIQNIKAMCNAIDEKSQSLSGPEIARGVTSFVTETILTVKVLSAAKTFYTGAQSKVIEFAKKVEQGIATAPELLASAEGLEVRIASEAAETVMLSTHENAAGIARKVSTTLKTMHEPIAWNTLDPALGDLTKIQKSESLLKSIPQAGKAQHPLVTLIENGQKNASSGHLGTARGALYELEVAAELEARGEKVLEFGSRIDRVDNGLNRVVKEFDIRTKNKVIECKDWDWAAIQGDKITKYKSTFQEQNLIAKHHNQILELYSKQLIPDDWKIWFSKKNIIFHEGSR